MATDPSPFRELPEKFCKGAKQDVDEILGHDTVKRSLKEQEIDELIAYLRRKLSSATA